MSLRRNNVAKTELTPSAHLVASQCLLALGASHLGGERMAPGLGLDEGGTFFGQTAPRLDARGMPGPAVRRLVRALGEDVVRADRELSYPADRIVSQGGKLIFSLIVNYG